MKLKRTITIALGCAAFAAWLSAAMVPARLPPVSVDSVVTRPTDVSAAALASEIARLRERLRPDSVPRAEPRDLFAFRASKRAASVTPQLAAGTSDVGAPATAAPFGLMLAGLAEDPVSGANSANDNVVRTAIITGHGQVFLAKEGDTIVDRDAVYVVKSISADSAELVDRRDDSLHRLALK